MACMGEGLRLCSLDRAGGEREETSVGTKALVQAVATALRLPSRFSSASAHHRRGAYFQAAKVGVPRHTLSEMAKSDECQRTFSV